MENKVAVITGGNAGLGLMIAERLISQHAGIHICLACRNRERAQQAVQYLLENCSQASAANITLLLVDISNLQSIYMAAAELRQRFSHIDYLYMNAGVMPTSTLNWDNLFKGLFSTKCVHMFTTAEGLLKQTDSVTSEGLQQTFVTNVFGHFVLIKELEVVLGGTTPTQIIWTSSGSAMKSSFNVHDIQHRNGMEPYSSSKYAIDVLSVALNNKYNKQNIYSHTTCPGLVITNLTYGILPSWVWWIFFPILCFFRFLVPSMNLKPYNGSEALVWLSRQNPPQLDPNAKYLSLSTAFGGAYVKPKKIGVSLEVAEQTYDTLDQLEQEMRQKCRPANS